MKRRALIGVVVLAVMVMALPASATVHETAGAACNGKDFLDPAGLGNFGFAGQSGNSPAALAPFGNFARPVIANGVVDAGGFPPVTTGAPASKFKPGLNALTLDTDDLDHASSDHCKNLNP